MRRSLLARLLAVVLALLGSLSAPALALSHGLTHDHLAREHRHEHEAEAPPRPSGPALDVPSDDDHAHGHPTVDVVPGTRDHGRFGLAAVGPAILPTPPAPLTALVVVRSAALTDRALLARPDPDGGPPPRLRAPPAR